MNRFELFIPMELEALAKAIEVAATATRHKLSGQDLECLYILSKEAETEMQSRKSLEEPAPDASRIRPIFECHRHGKMPEHQVGISQLSAPYCAVCFAEFLPHNFPVKLK